MQRGARSRRAGQEQRSEQRQADRGAQRWQRRTASDQSPFDPERSRVSTNATRRRETSSPSLVTAKPPSLAARLGHCPSSSCSAGQDRAQPPGCSWLRAMAGPARLRLPCDVHSARPLPSSSLLLPPHGARLMPDHKQEQQRLLYSHMLSSRVTATDTGATTLDAACAALQRPPHRLLLHADEIRVCPAPRCYRSATDYCWYCTTSGQRPYVHGYTVSRAESFPSGQ